MHAMSDDSKYFLFEDKLHQLFSVYILKDNSKKMEISNIVAADSQAAQVDVRFVKKYHIDVSKIKFKVWDYHSSSETNLTFSLMSDQLKHGHVKSQVDTQGNVTFMHTKLKLVDFNGKIETKITFEGCYFLNPKKVSEDQKKMG